MTEPWRTALVTGSSGFIGRHLVRHLVSTGVGVTCLCRAGSSGPSRTQTLPIDALTPSAIERVLAGRSFDVVFHLAAYGVSPMDRSEPLMQSVNVDATATLARLAAGWPARAMILTGSGSEYDFTGVTHPVEEAHALQTRSAYGVSKTAGGLAAQAAAEGSRMSVAVARLFNVYGPGEARHRLLPSLMRGRDGAAPIALSMGTQLRDFLHVSDVVHALTRLADAVATDPMTCVVNVASGQTVSVRQFCEMAADAMPMSRSLLHFGALPLRPDDTMYFSGNPGRLTALTGWNPGYSLAEGLAQTIATMWDAGHETPHVA